MMKSSPLNRLLAAAMFTAMFASGCQTPERGGDNPPLRARFYLESPEGQGSELVLPQSELRLAVNPQPVLTEIDLANVELVRVDLGQCLMFQLTPAAARDFYRLSGSQQGRRLVLTINDAPIGARRLDGPIADGAVFVFAEVPDRELPELVKNLKRSSAVVQRENARQP